MTEENKQQAVVEDKADDQSETGSEDTNAREDDDLESLLSQYEEKHSSDEKKGDKEEESKSSETESGPKPETDPDLKNLVQKFDKWERDQEAKQKAEAQRQFRQDMDSLVEKVRGENDPNLFDNDWVESWIETRARKDNRLMQAWLNRHENPQAFERITAKLGEEFNKKLDGLTDKRATEDREAVTAAVRGASNKAPEPKEPNYSAMSDAEFRKKVQEDYGFSPEV